MLLLVVLVGDIYTVVFLVVVVDILIVSFVSAPAFLVSDLSVVLTPVMAWSSWIVLVPSSVLMLWAGLILIESIGRVWVLLRPGQSQIPVINRPVSKAWRISRINT